MYMTTMSFYVMKIKTVVCGSLACSIPHSCSRSIVCTAQNPRKDSSPTNYSSYFRQYLV